MNKISTPWIFSTISVFTLFFEIACNAPPAPPQDSAAPQDLKALASENPIGSEAQEEEDTTPPVPSAPDESAGPDTPRRVLARIQGNLERIAAGEKRAPLRFGASPHVLEGLVEVFEALLKDDASVEKQLSAFEGRVIRQLSDKIEESFPKAERKKPGAGFIRAEIEMPAYESLMLKVLKEAPRGPKGYWIRFAALMRATDAALVLEGAEGPHQNQAFDLFSRTQLLLRSEAEEYRDGAFLRIPCPALRGRRELLEQAYKKLGNASGPLMGCPVAQEKGIDWALMERFAQDPAAAAGDSLPKKSSPLAPTVEQTIEPTPPPLPWDERAAIVFMAENPNEADRVLQKAAGMRAKLDRVLFLHAFRKASKERDGLIQRLQEELDKASLKALKRNPGDEALSEMEEMKAVPYDGSDESLLPTLRLASSSMTAQTSPAFYAIPCALLLARPGLVKATEPLFGGNRDNFLPRSGCAWGRGFVKGFPAAEFDAYSRASEEADGNFYRNFSGSMRFGLASAQQAFIERFRVNPKGILEDENSPAPAAEEPYLVWSYLSLENRAAYMRVIGRSSALRDKLLPYLMGRGLSEQQAKDAARRAIFHSVWGSDCGKAPPGRSLRKLLVEKAGVEEIKAFIQAGEHKKTEHLEAYMSCAEYAPMDPLIHVAVGHPAGLALIWEMLRGMGFRQAQELDLLLDPNRPNGFSKTPLMAAAQANQLESVRFLLKNGAEVNWATRRRSEPWLKHDARTPLMYAASRGSLALIRALLDAGADRFAADTRGFRALHYLLGHGPVAPNAVLSAEERAEAVKLLY